MVIKIQSDFLENDKEYTEGLIPFSNVVNHILDVPPIIYNPAQFQPKIIINYLKNYKVIKDMNVCPKCGKLIFVMVHYLKDFNQKLIYYIFLYISVFLKI